MLLPAVLTSRDDLKCSLESRGIGLGKVRIPAVDRSPVGRVRRVLSQAGEVRIPDHRTCKSVEQALLAALDNIALDSIALDEA